MPNSEVIKEKHAKTQFGGAVNKVIAVWQMGKVDFLQGSASTACFVFGDSCKVLSV